MEREKKIILFPHRRVFIYWLLSEVMGNQNLSSGFVLKSGFYLTYNRFFCDMGIF